MPVVIEPVPQEVTELKLGAVNVRRASGRERDPQGNLIPQGRIMVAVVLRRHANGVDGQDKEPIVVEDVEAWVTALATANDPLAADAAQWFATVDDLLKKLSALKGSQLGLCERPTA